MSAQYNENLAAAGSGDGGFPGGRRNTAVPRESEASPSPFAERHSRSGDLPLSLVHQHFAVGRKAHEQLALVADPQRPVDKLVHQDRAPNEVQPLLAWRQL